jgi:hypothetical protein
MKRMLMLVMVLSLCLGLAGAASAAKYADLTGTWQDLQSPRVYWAKDFGTETLSFTLVVEKQYDNGLFYGTVWGVYPVTGNIAVNKEIIAVTNGIDTIEITINAKLKGKTITGTYTLRGPGTAQVMTGIFKMTRISIP